MFELEIDLLMMDVSCGTEGTGRRTSVCFQVWKIDARQTRTLVSLFKMAAVVHVSGGNRA